MGRRAESKKRLPGRECIAVDQDLASSTAARLTANQWVLAAVAIPSEIRERAIGRWNSRVVSLDAAFHLRNQRLLQRQRGGKHRIRIGILVFEMRPDGWAQQRWIAHHRLPVRISEPGEFVGETDSMPYRGGTRFRLRRHRRLGDRCRSGHPNSGTVAHRGGWFWRQTKIDGSQSVPAAI